MFSKIFVLTLFLSSQAFASYEAANRTYGTGTIALAGYRRTIIELVNDGYYFSAIPWVKEYLVKHPKVDAEMEQVLDRMLYATSVKPFESLPEDILRRSRSGNIRYILAKRLLKKGNHQAALDELRGINSESTAFPFVANMKGTLYSHLGNYKEAEESFRDCIRASERMAGRSDFLSHKNQLDTNRDYCIAGIARVQFAQQDYKKAEINYLDIPKDSFVWPEILFEEAWTSYYVKNYNRTLGKLISYKAPVFDFVFKPEVELLTALTYLKMCLYEDAKKTVDTFYDERLSPSRDLRSYLMSHGKDYRFYYNLMADHEDRKPASSQMVNSILRSISKDAAYVELKGSLSSAVAEYNLIRKKPQSSMRANLMRNIQTLLDEYRTIVGAYVRAGLVSKYAELYAAFQGMSYIKLEVLAQRKEKLYQTETPGSEKRGDVKYIDRNDKQYFWNFNGEFWADELGDYVFALRSEC